MTMKEKKFILCVDDEKIVLDSLKIQLKQHFKSDCIIETAESGEEALEVIEDYKEDGVLPQVIISDQIMPNMRGSELLETIHNNYPEILKILLTGQADKNDVIEAVNNAGLYRYFAKPWDKMDLNITVSEALVSFQKDKELETQRKQLIVLNLSLIHI